MPHRDTSIAIQESVNPGSKWNTGTQAWLSKNLLIQALNETQGHKHGYPTSYYFSTLNALQRQKPSYPTSYISIPNDDNPTLQMSQRDTSLAIKLAINRSQMMGTIPYGCHTGAKALLYINSNSWHNYNSY